jgi:hypothetical protein
MIGMQAVFRTLIPDVAGPLEAIFAPGPPTEWLPPAARECIILNFKIGCAMYVCSLLHMWILHNSSLGPLGNRSIALGMKTWDFVLTLIVMGVCIFYFGREILREGKVARVLWDYWSRMEELDLEVRAWLAG